MVNSRSTITTFRHTPSSRACFCRRLPRGSPRNGAAPGSARSPRRRARRASSSRPSARLPRAPPSPPGPAARLVGGVDRELGDARVALAGAVGGGGRKRQNPVVILHDHGRIRAAEPPLDLHERTRPGLEGSDALFDALVVDAGYDRGVRRRGGSGSHCVSPAPLFAAASRPSGTGCYGTPPTPSPCATGTAARTPDTPSPASRVSLRGARGECRRR